MRTLIAALIVVGSNVHAAGTFLSLDEYLTQVKTGSPEARSTVQSIVSYDSLLKEGHRATTPELYAHLGMVDDQKPTLVPAFMGTETQASQWKLGVRQQTEYGFGADLFFYSQRTILSGISAQFVPVTNYMESSAVLQVTQSFWRNGFGQSTRAQTEMVDAGNEANLMQSKFHLKNLLLNAQNAYWSVVSFNQIVKLQQENVERAKKLRDYMTARTRMKLYDDVDAMQAEASFESRQLELQSSLDDRAAMVRQFNTLRGVDSDDVQNLDNLPTEELMQDFANSPKGHISREDFEMLRAQAKAALAKAKDSDSQVQPQLDLQASVATNGHDGMTSTAYDQSFSTRYPTYTIGLNFSMPLDLGLIHSLRRGYHNAQDSAKALDEQAGFNEQRAWDDLIKQRREAHGRFDRAAGVEKIQTDLVRKEHQRLLNGRTTTFEALNFEQNLALAQIQRVRFQLVLLQLNAAIKTFEVK